MISEHVIQQAVRRLVAAANPSRIILGVVMAKSGVINELQF